MLPRHRGAKILLVLCAPGLLLVMAAYWLVAMPCRLVAKTVRHLRRMPRGPVPASLPQGMQRS